MRDRSLVGRPMASRIMAMVMIPPAGIPAAPTLEAVAVTLEISNNQINTKTMCVPYKKSKDLIILGLTGW